MRRVQPAETVKRESREHLRARRMPTARVSVLEAGRTMATSEEFGQEMCDSRTLLSSISRRSHQTPTTRARRGPKGPSGTQGSSPEGSSLALSRGKAA
eukprot:2818218-Lingulodinium_polyedra.AAC.1